MEAGIQVERNARALRRVQCNARAGIQVNDSSFVLNEKQHFKYELTPYDCISARRKLQKHNHLGLIFEMLILRSNQKTDNNIEITLSLILYEM